MLCVDAHALCACGRAWFVCCGRVCLCVVDVHGLCVVDVHGLCGRTWFVWTCMLCVHVDVHALCACGRT